MARWMDDRPAFAALGGGDPAALFDGLKTPCYVIDEGRLRHNGELLASVARHTGCKILLAQKAFSNYDFYPLLSEYLAGTEASGLFEARLGAEEMPGREVHVFCAAYRDDELDELLKYADHIVFNSVSQLKRFGRRAKDAERASVCGSIRSAPPRKGTPFTIPARRGAGWVSPGRCGTGN